MSLKSVPDQQKSLTDRSISAMLWVLIDRAGASVINFAVTVTLARLLSPEDFGLVAMVVVFFEISGAFVESGFSVALIRETNISEADKSTTFTFNLGVALALYTALFFAAPAIADFFGQDVLVSIVRVMGITVVLSSLSIIQHITLKQRIDFRTQAKARFLAVIVSGAVGISMAVGGFGVWSLVAKMVVMTALNTVMLWIMSPWYPSLRFNVDSFRRLFGFGSKILISGLVDKVYYHAYNVLIGKFFAAALLGFFTQANNFVNIIQTNLFYAIQQVSYPVLSKLKDNVVRLREGCRQVLKLSSFVIVPGLTLLAVLARPAVVTLVGEKWLASVPFIQLLCVAGLTNHISVINLNILLVLGRADLTLRLEVYKKVVVTVAIITGIQFGIYGLIVGHVISTYISLIVNTYYSREYLSYSLARQIRDLVPVLSASALSGALAFSVSMLVHDAPFVQLAAGATAGTAVYLGVHLLARTEEVRIVRDTIIPRTWSSVSRLF